MKKHKPHIQIPEYKPMGNKNIAKISNKTALQELIEDIEAYKEEAMLYHNIRELTAINYVLLKCGLLEEKEKQQIMEAFENGKYGFGHSMEIYYTAKYGNPQGDPETTK
ncbi:hypothetical protein CQS02_20060 [Elizabethkingia miricola]|nr:hypothetical protein CQS02_20060 [Elizabethkingia miricola]